MRSRSSILDLEGLVQAPRRPQPPPEKARNEVLALNEQYIAAVRAGDASWFRAHMADDVVVIQGSGRRLTKSGFLDLMEMEPRRYCALTVEGVTARVFGETVQVDADAPWELEDGQRGVSRYIDSYAWLDGRWQVISAQVTLLP
jgi:ketosteroid isomerase-like protein